LVAVTSNDRALFIDLPSRIHQHPRLRFDSSPEAREVNVARLESKAEILSLVNMSNGTFIGTMWAHIWFHLPFVSVRERSAPYVRVLGLARTTSGT
jgi:hypothetical protein